MRVTDAQGNEFEWVMSDMIKIGDFMLYMGEEDTNESVWMRVTEIQIDSDGLYCFFNDDELIRPPMTSDFLIPVLV